MERRMGTTDVLKRFAASSLLVLSLAGCATGGAEPERDQALYDQVNSLTQPGRERAMREMQPGSWDTVHVFEEYTSKEEVQAKVHSEVDIEDYYAGPGQLLFFMHNGEIFRAVELNASRIPGGTYSSNLVLRGSSTPGGVRLEAVDS